MSENVKVLSQEEIDAGNTKKQQIRALVSNVYDIQKLRIAAGNRLVQSFYAQLGVEPSTSPNDVDKDEKKMIDRLKSDYKRISDAVSTENISIKKAIKTLNEQKKEGKDGAKPDRSGLQVIHDEMDYKLVDSYILLLNSEEQSIKVLEKYVQSHPLWDAFFKDIKGAGTLMAAMCIAYFDIRRARYVSSFYKYAGLDTVQDVDAQGNKLFVTNEDENTRLKVRIKYIYINSDGVEYDGEVKKTDDFTAEGEQIWLGENHEVLTQQELKRNVDGEDRVVYEYIDGDLKGEEYVGDVWLSEHGRRMGDTEMFEYIDKNGNKAMKRGITYNPVLKTKLMGVLSGCLLKAKDPVYSTIYYDYRRRLDNAPRYMSFSDGRRNMMALRYMIKQFLRNLWTTWRTIEGLEVNYPYEVAKLGNKPHKYNQYQCDEATKWEATHPSEFLGKEKPDSQPEKGN